MNNITIKSNNKTATTLRGEAALIFAVIINSVGVLLMLQSGSGIIRYLYILHGIQK